MQQLKPCPNVLCGSEDVEVEKHWEYSRDIGYGEIGDHYSYTIRCKSCNAETKKRTYECDAVKLWHDRPQVFNIEQVKSAFGELINSNELLSLETPQGVISMPSVVLKSDVLKVMQNLQNGGDNVAT